ITSRAFFGVELNFRAGQEPGRDLDFRNSRWHTFTHPGSEGLPSCLSRERGKDHARFWVCQIQLPVEHLDAPRRGCDGHIPGAWIHGLLRALAAAPPARLTGRRPALARTAAPDGKA